MNFEEAKKLLTKSGKSGKIVRKGEDNWGVEFIKIETSHKKEIKSEQSKESVSSDKKNLSFESLSHQRTFLSKEIYKLKAEIKELKGKQLNHMFDDFNSSEIKIKTNEKKIINFEEEINNLDLYLEQKELILRREPPKVTVGRFDYLGSLKEEKKIKNNHKMTYEEAKKLLNESGKCGKIVRKGEDNWGVEFIKVETSHNKEIKSEKSKESVSIDNKNISSDSLKNKKIEIQELPKKEKIIFNPYQNLIKNDISWLKMNNEFVQKSGNIYSGLQIYHPTTSEMFDYLSGRILDFKEGKSYALGFYAFLLSKIIPQNSQIFLTSVPGSSPRKEGSLNRIIKKLSGGPIIDGSKFLETISQREKKSHGFRPTNEELSQTIKLNRTEFPRDGKILLLDDVTTSGQSFDVCKKIIRDSGYQNEITCLALSVTDRHSKQRGIALNTQLIETWDIKPINNSPQTIKIKSKQQVIEKEIEEPSKPFNREEAEKAAREYHKQKGQFLELVEEKIEFKNKVKINQPRTDKKIEEPSKPFNREEAEKAAREYHKQKGQFLELDNHKEITDKIKGEIKKGINKFAKEYHKQKNQFLEKVDEKDIKNKIKREIKKGIKKASDKFINFFK